MNRKILIIGAFISLFIAIVMYTEISSSTDTTKALSKNFTLREELLLEEQFDVNINYGYACRFFIKHKDIDNEFDKINSTILVELLDEKRNILQKDIINLNQIETTTLYFEGKKGKTYILRIKSKSLHEKLIGTHFNVTIDVTGGGASVGVFIFNKYKYLLNILMYTMLGIFVILGSLSLRLQRK
ncbi:hypothetical protein GCM10009118_07450 [Wandonia haliotis]|uniref:Uncharacterized protein n=1 Tax=Wandonia haliotis TaxID=574963 RepID=A0ABN1MN23_9FLAO